MNFKTLGIVFLLLIIPVIGFWIYSSVDYGEILIFSRDSKNVEIEKYDELLGTTTTEVIEKEGYWFGLLPAEDRFSLKATFSAFPIGGVLIALAAISFIIKFKKNKTPK